MTNPTETPLRERIAVMLGWRRIEETSGRSFWQDTEGNLWSVGKEPPWDTDDGTALGALEEWCEVMLYEFEITRYHEGSTLLYFVRITDKGYVLDRDREPVGYAHNESLTTAICDAMLAASEAGKND